MTFHRTLLLAALPATLLAGCGDYRGLESARQPVVSRTDYALDLNTSGYALAPGEDARLAGWLSTMRVGYGDTVSIDDPSGAAGVREQIGAQAADRGLLLADTAPVTAGAIAPGTVRVVVSRATARVPNCPDFRGEEAGVNFSARTSANYGCGVNSTLSAMVANPVDLVRGQPGSDTLGPATAVKAVDAYRKAVPSGAGGQNLKSESAGGK